jgi:hypothetical protein
VQLDPNLRLSNRSRISSDFISNHIVHWQTFEPQYPYIPHNNDLLSAFIKILKSDYLFTELKPKDPRHSKIEERLHKVTSINDINLIITLLNKFKANNLIEKLRKASIIQILSELTSNNIWIIQMSPSIKASKRMRTIKFDKTADNSKNKFSFSSIFTGDIAVPNGKNYFGDRSLLIKTKNESTIPYNYNDEVIIQLHSFYSKDNVNRGDIKTNDLVQTITIYFPESMKKRYISLK